MTENRFKAVEEAFVRKPYEVEPPEKITSSYFGCKVFNRKAMRKYLSEETRRRVYESSEQNVTLDRETAEHVAAGMKRWAMDMGVTHYTHWFQPLTGGTAEKHDSFIEPYRKSDVIEAFSGKLLCQQESDASSFPSGGLRNTFEARGYTAWDPSSPAFIMDDCLCIPTVFVSYTGEALDFKSPLLRSEIAVSKSAEELLKYFGIKNDRVISYLGWEQEYFLVDSSLYAQRPDLILADRTLFGQTSARNQQLEDHYFGTIPKRVLAFMKDLEFEAYKLGIPIKTRHNEVAPNQFEIAPVYETANLAIDHNLLVMSLMKEVGERHGFKVLLHEKPFAGINGSGKHCNWSIGTESGIQLFSPGKTEKENLRFLMFIANALKAVYDHNSLIKASIMSASNEHRLGCGEAPPAIISSYLGVQIQGAFEQLIKNKSVKIKDTEGCASGIPHVPDLIIDSADRNRTSPFAFTGNRFELRAVGSSANCSYAISILNTILAYQMTKFNEAVKKRIESGEKPMDAIIEETGKTYKECSKICFNGNGYSEEWKKEAISRGLDYETSVPLTYDVLTSKDTVKTFSSTGVMTEVELKARQETCWEIYSKKIEIEAKILIEMINNMIFPATIRYKSMLLDVIERGKTKVEFEKKTYAKISDEMESIQKLIDSLSKECEKASSLQSEREKAIAFNKKVSPYLPEIRERVDTLESIVDDRLWPLPKYRELLFIR